MSSSVSTTPLRLATRGSRLAMAQSRLIAGQLEKAHRGLQVELVVVTTTGDRVTDRPLADAGGKGLFTKEIELALLAGEADFAVHSYKDVPATMPLVDQAELAIAAVPKREDARDVLVTADGRGIADLEPGCRVGTTSARRAAQLLDARPDVTVVPLRGNIDTRLAKRESGEVDAILLAMAGLLRAGLFDATTMHPIDPQHMLPAAGQGALALQCRRDKAEIIERLAVLHHEPTAHAVDAERAVVIALEGDCHSPIGVWADRGWLHACYASEGVLRRAVVPFPDEKSALEAAANDLASRLRG